MHPLNRRWANVCVALIALGAVGLVATYRWRFGKPLPPRDVDGTYSFVRNVYVITPEPGYKGEWIGCRRTATDTAICRAVDQGGTVLLQTTYKACGQGPSPPGQARVDGRATDWREGVVLMRDGVGYAYAPFIHLVGGEVLLPAAAFPAALKKYRDEMLQPPC